MTITRQAMTIKYALEGQQILLLCPNDNVLKLSVEILNKLHTMACKIQ